MPVMRAVLEFDTKDGSAKIKEVAGGFEDVGKKAKTAGDAIKNGFLERIGKAAFDGLLSVLRSIPAAFSSSIRSVIDYGGKLVDMRAKTAIAIEAQQQLAHAGKLVGVSFESDIVPAIGKMQQALTDAPEKFMRLGLSVTDLRKMKPEDQFLAIGERIGQIADPAQRATAAISIFGKAGATLLPLFTSNVRQAMEEAKRLGLVMSTEVAEAADDLGDSLDTMSGVWEGFTRNVGAAVVTSEPLHLLIKGLTEILGNLSKMVHDNQTTVRAWIDGAVVGAAHALVELVNVIEVALAVLKALADMWSYLKAAGLAFILTWKAQFEVMAHPTKALEVWKQYKAEIKDVFESASAEVADHQKALDAAAGVSGKVKNVFEQLEKTVAAGVGITHKSTEETQANTGALGENAKAQAERLRIEKLVEAQAGKNRVDAIKKVDDELKAEYERGIKVVEQYLDKRVKDSQEANDIEARGIEGQIRLIQQAADKYQMWGNAAGTLANVLRGTLGSALSGLAGMFDGLAAHQRQAADNLEKYGTTAMTTAQKVQAAAQAASGAIAIYQNAYASKSGTKGALSGAAHGAEAGSAFGPYGAIIGGAVGLGIGLVAGKKGAADELRALRKEFDELQHQAERAGVTFQKSFDSFTAKGLKQAIADMKQALDMKPLQNEFNRLMVVAKAAGMQFKFTFDTRTPERYAESVQDAIDKINKALDTQAEAQQKVQDAIERYGFTEAELGPTLQKQHLDEQMAQIYQDWQLLSAAGVDHQAMLERIGPKVGTLVDQYKGAGIEIPSAMKPIIDDLYEHHKLLHENGEEYTEAEYKGLTYTQTMSEMFQSLIEKVTELVNAILGIPNKTVVVNVHKNDPDNVLGGGGGGGGDRDSDDRQERNGGPRTNHALGLNRWVLPGEPAMRFAEAGRPEYVYASSNGPPAASGGGQSGPQQVMLSGPVTLEIDGQEFRAFIKRKTRGGYLDAA